MTNDGDWIYIFWDERSPSNAITFAYELEYGSEKRSHIVDWDEYIELPHPAPLDVYQAHLSNERLLGHGRQRRRLYRILKDRSFLLMARFYGSPCAIERVCR
jgi:hypothetical protein